MIRILPWCCLACVAALGCKPERPAAREDQVKAARARATAHGLEREASDRARGEAPDPHRESAGALTEAQRGIVVATVGSVTITLGDIERRLAAQPAYARARYATLAQKQAYLENIVNFELLALEAHERGYDTHPDVVLAMKRALVHQFTSDDLARLTRVSQIDEADIRRYYENNPTQFNKPEQVRPRLILFKDEATATRVRAEIVAATRADPRQVQKVFGERARQNSEHRDSGLVNGDLGYLSRDGYVDRARREAEKLPDAVVAAAFALAHPGDISPLVKVDAGWYLLCLVARRPAVKRSLEDARRQITNLLLRERQDAARKKYIDALRAKAKVTIDMQALKDLDVSKIRTRAGEGDEHPPKAHDGKAAPAAPKEKP